MTGTAVIPADLGAHSCNRPRATTSERLAAPSPSGAEAAVHIGVLPTPTGPNATGPADKHQPQPGRSRPIPEMEAIQMTDFFTMLPGETAAPVPPGPVLSSGSTGIRRVHRFLLWAYREAPNLVRSTAAGDTARAARVGEVLGNFDKVLLVHQEGQNLFMYPQLAERAPACASHVEQMLQQHRGIKDRVESIGPVRKRWMQTAEAGTRDELAKGYEDVHSVLSEHLRREVTEVMPAVDRVMTEEELNAMVQHGVRQHDKKFLVTYLGLILATNPPEDRRAIFFEEIPALARLGYRLIGRRMYRRQYAALFPGRPIPETL